MQHAMSWIKGGSITVRHNDIRNLTGNLPTIICKYLKIEPKLLTVTGQAFPYQTANISNKARVDHWEREFWERISSHILM